MIIYAAFNCCTTTTSIASQEFLKRCNLRADWKLIQNSSPWVIECSTIKLNTILHHMICFANEHQEGKRIRLFDVKNDWVIFGFFIDLFGHFILDTFFYFSFLCYAINCRFSRSFGKSLNHFSHLKAWTESKHSIRAG